MTEFDSSRHAALGRSRISCHTESARVRHYDTVLKPLLTGSQNSLFHLITGAKRGRWLNVELPKVVQARVDLLFELASSRKLEACASFFACSRSLDS